MNGKFIRPALLIFFLLTAVISCKKTENDIIRAPSLNCQSTTLNPVVLTNSGSPQNTTLTVGLNDAIAGLITFALTSSNADFTPTTYTTTVTDGQLSVAIPLTFDGTSEVTTETITVSATSYGLGACSPVATISAGTSTTTAPDCSTATTPTAKVVCAAEAFLATLSATQKAMVLLEYTKENATKWSNLPCGSACRLGLPLASLTASQVTAALAVVAAATGTTPNEGYGEINQIRAADDLLKATGNGGYSSGNYFIAFLGTPATMGTWQLQFGGHQLAINTTYTDGIVKGATPMFEGVEPRSWTATNGIAYAPLNNEQSAMAAMLASLTNDQLASAKLSTTVNDVVLGPTNDGKFPGTKAGIRVSTLNAAQQELVMAAMKPWLQDTDETTASGLLAIYKNELADTFVSYSGNATLTTNADYVRIDGPGVWIEFVCQKGAVYSEQLHYRSIWRDHTRDYGGNFTF